MNKQEISHTLKEEIEKVDLTIARMQRVCCQTVDSHQIREIATAINDLENHKKALEEIIEAIYKDARSYNPPFPFSL